MDPCGPMAAGKHVLPQIRYDVLRLHECLLAIAIYCKGDHTRGQGPGKTYFYLFFEIFWGIFGIFGQILRFLIKIMCFLSFSGKNDAES